MELGADPFWRETRDGLVLAVRLTPKSSSDAISGVTTHGDMSCLKARVRAVPDKGKANAALEKLVAAWLGVPLSAVQLESGARSRQKSLTVRGDGPQLRSKLKAALAGLE